VRLKSSQGVAYKKAQIEVIALETVELALTVEPTGRVYESISGDLLDGAELFLYRDEDTDDDPFDDESFAQRTLVSEGDLESPTQQGQRSAQGGMYRFGVKRPGRYLIEVIPPGVRYVSPSTLVPPLPVSVSASGDVIEMVSSSLPSADSADERRYTLAFEVNDPKDDGELQLRNNHIALDPLSALIQVDKRSRRVQYMVGDIVTYEVDIINRSPQDLVYDAQRRAGGVYLEDVLPKGLKYIARSAVWAEVIGARERPLLAADPSGARILRFGRVEDQIDGMSGSTKSVQRPVDLKAGAHLRLRYQAVIGPQAKPMRSYTNRARLLADGDIPISSVARAKIQVIADPDFDQGLLLGRVWCDANRDGLPDEGEPGLMGARVYFDSGMYAVTDSAGKYHFKMIDPGSHAVKVDTNSLLPGAEMTTDELRVIYFSRGLPARVNFGVTCPVITSRESEVELGERAMREALARLGGEAVIVSGDLTELTVEVGALRFSAPKIDVQVKYEGDVPDLTPPPAGAPMEPMQFKIQFSEDARSEVERWSLWVAREGAEEQPVMSGIGPPPSQISWDGRDALGRALARRGLVLSYRFEAATPQLIMSSPLHRIGIGVTVPPEPEVLLTFPAAPFDPDNPTQLSEEDRASINEVVARLRAGYECRLIVDAHAGGEDDAAFLTSARAEAIAEILRDELKLKTDDIISQGSANLFPFATNLTLISRRRNRRVQIRLEQLKPDPKAVEMLNRAIEVAPIARAGGDERRPNEQGRFVMVTQIPKHGTVELYLRDRRGAAVTYALTLSAGAFTTTSGAQGQKSEKSASKQQSQPLSVGGVWGESLSLGGSSLPSMLFKPTLTLEPGNADELTLKSKTNLTVDALGDGTSIEITRWTLMVIDDGESLDIESGEGNVPTTLEWSPLEALTSDTKIALKLRLEGQITRAGQLGRPSGLSGRIISESAPLWLSARDQRAITINPATTSPKSLWRLKLGDRSFEGAPKTRVEGSMMVPTRGAISLTLTRPDGSSLSASLLAPRIMTRAQAQSAATASSPSVKPSARSSDKSSGKPSSKASVKVRRRRIKEMGLWMGGGLGWQIDELLTPRPNTSPPLQVDLLLPSDALLGAPQDTPQDQKNSVYSTSINRYIA
jgi:uncharacterized repeat protein (TIGR01451 family)